MFQLSDLLPGRSPPQQKNSSQSQHPPEEPKPSDHSLGVIEAVVTETPADRNGVEPDKIFRDKFNDEISYTLMSNCNLRPSRVFTVTPVSSDKIDADHERNTNKDVTKSNKQHARVIRRTSSGLPTVSISGQHGNNNNDPKNKMFLRNDTSPVILKTKNTNITKPNTQDRSSDLTVKKQDLTKTLSSHSFRKQANANTTISTNGTGKALSSNSNVKHGSVLGRSNTEIKLTKPSHQQLNKPLQPASSIVFHPAMGRSNTQDCFTELMKNNSLTMPAGAAQFFIRSPGELTTPGSTALARSNTETTLLDDSLEDLNANTNSLNRNSGMRVLGYIWTFWNKGQQNPGNNSLAATGSSSNGIIRIPPGRM